MLVDIETLINLIAGLAAFVLLILTLKKRKDFKTDKKRRALWIIGLLFFVVSWLAPLVFTTILPKLVRLSFWVFIPWYVKVLMKIEAIICLLFCILNAGKNVRTAVHIAVAAVVFCVCLALTVSYTLSLNVVS